MDTTTTRRRFCVGSALGLAELAGCGSPLGADPDGTETPPSYDHLRTVALYLGPTVELDVPDRLERVSATNNADLLVFADETDTDADRAVEWFAEGRSIALLGPEAEPTFHDWARSAPYRDAFTGGSADAEPDPDLLVAVPQDTLVSTHRHTWGSGYTDDDVIEALDDAFDPE